MSAVEGYGIHVMICQSKKTFKDYEYKFTAKNVMNFTLKSFEYILSKSVN